MRGIIYFLDGGDSTAWVTDVENLMGGRKTWLVLSYKTGYVQSLRVEMY